MLDLLTEIDAELQAVTPEDIRRAQRQLDQRARGETPLGTLHNRDAIGLHTLSHMYVGRALLKSHEAHFQTHDEEQEKLALEEVARFKAMAELARELFWLQAKTDIGGSAWTSGSIGVRADWIIVSCQDATANPLARLLGGLGGE